MGMTVSKYMTTNDGVKLHYLEEGIGQPLVMLPGWSQSAEQFKYQIEGLKENYRCLALDWRGHGESQKVTFGYKIQRLCQDLHEWLEFLELKDVVLMGHSMGASVIWCYWDLFRERRLSKLIFVDEPSVLIKDPTWSEQEVKNYGASFDFKTLLKTCHQLTSTHGNALTSELIKGMVTSEMSLSMREWIIKCNLKLPREQAASLLFNNCVQDWRDVIPRIKIPTLIVGGRVSVTCWQSQVWIHQQIEGSELSIFEEEEGGQHFLFIEGASKFNQLIRKFIG